MARPQLNHEPSQLDLHHVRGIIFDCCLVFEGTDPGLEAARRACMESVDVRDFHTPRRVT